MATEILRPNAAGDETNLNPNDTDNYAMVDEEIPDDDTTKVYNAVENGYKRDLYNLPAHSEGSGTINFIKIYFRCKCGVAGLAKPSLKSNSTVTDGTEVELTTSYVTYSEQWDTNPADSEAWEWDDIDALQIGVSLRAPSGAGLRSAHCTQVYVEVDYTAGGATEKQSSDSGTGTDAKASGNPVASINGSETGSGADSLPARDIALPDTGSGVDAYDSLEKGEGEIKTSSDTGSGIEALIFRLLAAVDTGGGVEAVVEIEGLLKNLFASELGEGSDCLAAKIETPTKGGGMKLWI